LTHNFAVFPAKVFKTITSGDTRVTDMHMLALRTGPSGVLFELAIMSNIVEKMSNCVENTSRITEKQELYLKQKIISGYKDDITNCYTDDLA
jgi:hypothetical protein